MVEEYLINKKTVFRFDGTELSLGLSHSLFSSFDVDAGSRLLLKSIAKKIPLPGITSILDIGCGAGVLGLSIKKRISSCTLHACDRDALALAFTAFNADANGISDVFVFGSVGLMHLPQNKYVLIVSNIPAKAGDVPIESILRGISAHLAPDGVFACVIIKSLSGLVEKTVSACNGTVIYREDTKMHSVFHVRNMAFEEPDKTLKPYVRGHSNFQAGKITYGIDTVLGIPEFDTLSYATELLFDIHEKSDSRGNVLVWNPGQGHAPILINKKGAHGNTVFTLASRDLLSLEISKKNCLSSGIKADSIGTSHVSSVRELSGTFDLIIAFPDKDPGSVSYRYLLADLLARLAKGGKCYVSAKSSLVYGILEGCKGYKVVRSRKEKGYRACALRLSDNPP